jgi:transcription initiation factor TFIID TATA-box-binding protein
MNQLEIVNIVATADLKQFIKLERLNEYKWGTYDCNIYPAGYIKDDSMKGRVTVFHTGKLISVGARSIHGAILQLKRAVELLASSRLIKDTTIKPQIRNIVATLNLMDNVDLESLCQKLPNTIFEPEQFPAIIFRPKDLGVSFLIFASGKVVIVGAKNFNQVKYAKDFIIKIVNAVNS